MDSAKQIKNNLLPRIVRHLMLNASFSFDTGLYHGKMGIALFFAHYGRYAGNTLYNDFAGELLDEIYEDIHTGTPVDFENGLCGIGWGIEYLLQNGFMEGDSDDVLSEIDRKIMEWDVRRITDLSFRTGLGGISCYIRKRINSPCRNQDVQLFDKIYLSDWEAAAKIVEIPDERQILLSVTDVLPEGDNIPEWELGLENGCAGYGLRNVLGFK